jgi:transcription elongation factor Elf1
MEKDKQVRIANNIECPVCHNISLSDPKKYPSMTATKCKVCGEVIQFVTPKVINKLNIEI